MVLTAIALFLASLALFFLVLPLRTLRWPVVEAIVVDNIDTDDQWRPVVEFVDKHGRQHTAEVNIERSPKIAEGTALAIKYSPKDPSTAVLAVGYVDICRSGNLAGGERRTPAAGRALRHGVSAGRSRYTVADGLESKREVPSVVVRLVDGDRGVGLNPFARLYLARVKVLDVGAATSEDDSMPVAVSQA